MESLLHAVRDYWFVFAGALTMAAGFTIWLFNLGRKMGALQQDFIVLKKTVKDLDDARVKDREMMRLQNDKVDAKFTNIETGQKAANTKLDTLIGQFDMVQRHLLGNGHACTMSNCPMLGNEHA